MCFETTVLTISTSTPSLINSSINCFTPGKFKSSNTIPGLLLNLRELSILDKNVHSKVWSY